MTLRTESFLFRIALGCAFLMLLGPVADRTTWVNRRSFADLIDAAAYIMAALLSGIAAIGALAFADWARPRAVVPMILGLAGAIAAFGFTVWV